MKKYKTVLGNISQSQLAFSLDKDIEAEQRKYKQNDQQILVKKNQLLQKQVQLLKESKKSMYKQLQAYRKVVLKNGDIHQLLQLQHQKIFDLQTNMQVLQHKYDKLLSANGSGNQTQYAIKCKQLESILKNKQIQHQKQISTLKGKMMRMNASELLDNNRSNIQFNNSMNMRTNSNIINPNGNITPLKNSRKLV